MSPPAEMSHKYTPSCRYASSRHAAVHVSANAALLQDAIVNVMKRMKANLDKGVNEDGEQGGEGSQFREPGGVCAARERAAKRQKTE